MTKTEHKRIIHQEENEYNFDIAYKGSTFGH